MADELIGGREFTKFPGGDIEFSEGSADAAWREAMEEFGQEIELTGHFYTTDFFILSAFRDTDQIISIYYTAILKAKQVFLTTERPFDFKQKEKNKESFRGMCLAELSADIFQFPDDKEVVMLLKKLPQV